MWISSIENSDSEYKHQSTMAVFTRSTALPLALFVAHADEGCNGDDEHQRSTHEDGQLRGLPATPSLDMTLQLLCNTRLK